MRTCWEYLALVWEWSFIWDEANVTGTSQAKWYLWRPRVAEPEVFDAETTGWLSLANDLGAEGWELVSDDVLCNIVGQAQGWPKASRPVRRRLTFKRPLP